MKTSLPFKKALHLLTIIVTCSATSFGQVFTKFGQSFTSMNFENPVLESGTYGADSSSYRFSNVNPGIDAVITITGRSSAAVVLSTIDTVGAIGYDKAFQPVLGIPGTAPANTTWWMDFSMSLYETGTMVPVMPMQFYATGLDIDGDGGSIYEWAEMHQIESIDSALINSLTFTQLSSYFQGYDYRIQGIIANSPGIDTSAGNVMATYKYANKHTITFRIGATTVGSGSSAAMRLNSIWFKNLFVGSTLAVNLVSFTATREANVTQLKWTTSSEADIDRFVVERSYDNKNFTAVATILPQGALSYIVSDNVSESSSAIVYYRLHTIEIAGKGEYSAVRIIKLQSKNDKLGVSAYPNPVTNNLLVTLPASWQGKSVIFELLSVSGQVTKRIQSTQANQTESLAVNSIPTGAYFLRASCEGRTVQEKIIKN